MDNLQIMSKIKNKLSHFWFNSDERTRKMNRNVIYSIMLKGFSVLISLLLVPLTLGYLNSYEYGVWITINSVLTWINVMDIGLGNGLRNKLAECVSLKDFTNGKAYVSTTMAILTAISVLICLAGMIMNCFVDWNHLLNIDRPIANLNTIINVVLLCISVNFTIRTVGLIYLSYQETFMNDLLVCLSSLLSLIWIWLLTKFTAPSLMNVALAFSVSPIIVYVLAYPYTFLHRHREIKPGLRHVRKEFMRPLAGLGVKFFILQVACLLLFFTSNILISNIFSPAEVTPYSIAYKYFSLVYTVFMLMVNPLWSAITDAYVKRDTAWLEASMRKALKVFALSVAVIIVMVCVSKFIYRIWVGPGVEISYALSISLAVFNIVYIWSNLYSTWCNGVGHLKMALYSMCAAAVLFIPTCIWFANMMGLPGVAFSLATVLLIPCFFLYLQYRRDIRKLKASVS